MSPAEISVSTSELSERLVPVVLGGEILAYSYARCFHEAYGIKTVVISGADVKVTSSSAFTDYRISVEYQAGAEQLVPMLVQMGKDYLAAGKIAILLGSADWQVRLICEHASELSPYYVIPYNSLELLNQVTQKGVFYGICEELGMAYPKTQLFNCAAADALSALVEDTFTYPLIAKPSNSGHYDLLTFAGKEKIYTVKDAADLKRIFGLLHDAGYKDDLVVQEFVPGDDDAIFSLTTFSDASGSMRVVSGGRVVLQDHSPARIGNPVTIHLERVEQLIADAKKFCEHTGYVGFANFDAKYDERDGSYKFFEVNARPGANTFYMYVGGVNFATLIVDAFVLCREIAYQEAYADGLYTLVPAKVIEANVPNAELRSKTLAYYKAKNYSNPFNAKGETLAHKFWAAVRWWRQIDKFKQFPAC